MTTLTLVIVMLCSTEVYTAPISGDNPEYIVYYMSDEQLLDAYSKGYKERCKNNPNAPTGI